MVNTRNKATNYKTGTQFHLDLTANQFLTKTFAIGARDYYYKQLTGDNGSGAILSDFKSEPLGFGPGFVWIPVASDGKLTIVGKTLHDVFAKRRFKSN